MGKNIKFRVDDGFAIIEFDTSDSKVNVLSAEVLREFDGIISQVYADSGLKGLILLSAKPDIFIAGADIKEIEKITVASEGQEKARAGQKIINRLEKLPIPSIALINGACLGGGLELALACDWRLCSVSEKVKIGLPEVKLGIIPGFGGTKRLPRLTGLRKGLQMILSGEVISGKDALKIGLVEGIFLNNLLLEEAKIFLKAHPGKRKLFQPKLKGLIAKLLDGTFIGRLILKDQTKKFVLKTTKGQYPAPLKALEVVTANYNSSLEAALEREAVAFGSLVIGEISKNLVSVFYLVEKYKKVKWVEAQPRKIHKSGLLGAGIMGGGIAQLFSYYGVQVRMKDLNYQALGKGLKQAKEVYDSAVKKRKIKPNQADLGMGLISVTCDYSGFQNAGLIVEAVVEDMNIKKKVWNEVSAVASGDAIIASNTSCLSVEGMSGSIQNKTRAVGMHFFNPVHRMPLIEIIRAPQTSDETVATIVEFSRKIGKTPIVVKDTCGFLVNRILLPYLNEAGFLLMEGVDFERVDNICLKFGMPMGPFTLMDEIGLDVGYKVALLLEEHFGQRMKVSGVLKEVYAKKWFGKKTGIGFYVHKGREKRANKEIVSLTGVGKGAFIADEEILKRIIYKMINEAAMCLHEGVCREASDVDIGMIMGIGFPPFKGGLLRYADLLGADEVVNKLDAFKTKVDPERFAACDYLREMAKNKGKFYK